MSQIEVSFICSFRIFFDMETLELLTVSLNYENLLPRLTLPVFVLFVELCHLYLFVTIAKLYYHVWTAANALQFSSGTILLNFVWLSHNALSLTINLFIVSFSFKNYPCFVWTATPFCLFSEWNCPTLLCVNVTQMLCVSSPLSLCECHTCVSSFLCVNVTRISLCLHYF